LSNFLEQELKILELETELLSKHINTDLLKLFKGLFLLNNFLFLSRFKANSNIDMFLTLAFNTGSLVKRYLPKYKLPFFKCLEKVK